MRIAALCLIPLIAPRSGGWRGTGTGPDPAPVLRGLSRRATLLECALSRPRPLTPQ